jgi:hydroxymethylbilane synthase
VVSILLKSDAAAIITMSSSSEPTVLRLGTRGSLLARTQSQLMADELERRHPGLHVELVIFKTSGDQIADRPLHELGGKGLFIRELEMALLSGEVDFAVHSYKDVPVTMPLVEQENLTIAAVPPREDPRDVLVSAKGKSIQELPAGAVVGTGSLRRRSQLLAARPDLRIEMIRGNIDTRLRKLVAGEFDAIVLAHAGIKRAALFDSEIMTPIGTDELVPCAGQGILAVQCRRDDAPTAELLSVLHNAPASLCSRLEREVVRLLEGDCHSPIGVVAAVQEGQVRLRAAIGRRGGEIPVLHASAEAPLERPDGAVAIVMQQLSDQDVRAHLHG